METTTYDGPPLLDRIIIDDKIKESSTTVYILVGVLIGLVVLNIVYRIFLRGFCANRRNRRVEPQEVEVVVINNAAEGTAEKKSNEKSIETKEKFEINELINHISK